MPVLKFNNVTDSIQGQCGWIMNFIPKGERDINSEVQRLNLLRLPTIDFTKEMHSNLHRHAENR